MTGWLVQFINILFQVLIFAIVARALLSWFNLGPTHPIVRILYDVTEPILRPIRNMLPQTGMMDFSPLIVFLVISVLLQLIPRIF